MTEDVHCSFCNERGDDELTLVAGLRGVRICEECLELCEDILRDDDVRAARALEACRAAKRASELGWEQLYEALCAARFDPSYRPSGLICGFCGATAPEGGRMIAGPTVFICAVCVVLFGAVLLKPFGLHTRRQALPSPADVSDGSAQLEQAAEREAALGLLRAEWRRRCDAKWVVVVAAAHEATASAPEPVPSLETFGGHSAWPADVLDLVRRIAPLQATVMISGGSTTAQMAFARTLHDLSSQKGPLLRLDCRLAGALAYIDCAEHGSLLLDEPNALSTPEQSLLLDCLERGLNSRLIVTTSSSAALEAAVAAGLFSEPLYFRLNVVSIDI